MPIILSIFLTRKPNTQNHRWPLYSLSQKQSNVFYLCSPWSLAQKQSSFFHLCLYDHSLIHSIYVTFYLDDFAFMTHLSDFDDNLCSLCWVHVGLVILFFLSWERGCLLLPFWDFLNLMVILERCINKFTRYEVLSWTTSCGKVY